MKGFFFKSVGVLGGSPELGKGNSGWVPSPSAYEMHCDAISITHITHANISPCIYSHNLNHTNMSCNFTFPYTKISSLGLIIKHEQFNLNYSVKHILTQKFIL